MQVNSFQAFRQISLMDTNTLVCRLILIGTGVVKDQGTVMAVSREGNRCTQPIASTDFSSHNTGRQVLEMLI